MGAVVIFGWYTKNATLLQINPTFAPMQFNAALGFLLSGLGLLSIIFKRRRFTLGLGFLVSLIGTLTLVEYIAGLGLGIDQFFMEGFITVKTSHPGRMAPNTAVNFFLIGAALFILGLHLQFRGKLLIASLLAALALALGSISILGYLFGVETAYGWGKFTEMALHTSIGFVIVGFGTYRLALARIASSIQEQQFTVMGTVLIGGLTISLGIWLGITSQNVSLIRNGLESELLSVSSLIENEIKDINHAVERDIGDFGSEKSFASFKETHDLFDLLDDHPGLVSMVWVDNLFLVRWEKTGGRPTVFSTNTFVPEINIADLEQARDSKIQFITPANSMPGQEPAILVFHPVYNDAGFDGFVLEVLALKPLLANVLSRLKSNGLEIALSSNGIFLLQPFGGEPMPQDQWLVTRNFKAQNLPLNLSLWPNENSAILSNSRVATLVIILGVFLSGVVALLLNQLYKTRQTTANLKEAQVKLQLILDYADDVITLRDKNAKVVYLSPSYEKHFGKSPKDEIGKQPWKRMLAKAYPKELKEWFKTVYEDGKNFRADFYLKTKDGTFRWFENFTTPIKDETKKVMGSLTVSRDITDRKQAEEKLKTLANHTTDIIFLHGKKGEIVYITPAVKKHLGLDPESVVGQQTLGVLHPEDKKTFPRQWNKRVFKEGKSLNRDLRLRNKNGDYLWFECHSEPIKNEKGKVIAAVTTARNITEYKRAENDALRLGRIVEDSLNEIYTFDQKTLKFTGVNRGARKNLGFSMEELYKMTPVDIKHEFTKKSFSKMLQPLISGQKDQIRFETVHQRKDGSVYDVEVYLQLSKVGLKPVFVAMIEDITEKKVNAKILRQAQKMEAVGNLTGGVAHDFNNLLTAVLGSLQYLKMSDEKLSKEAQELIDIAVRSSQRGAELTRRLLAFSRTQTLKPIVLDVNGLIRDLMPLLRQTIEESIEIENRLLPGKIFVNVDKSELDNSLLNLAVNARDAMPKGGYLIFEVKTEKLTQANSTLKEITPGDYAVISVSDNGHGMTPEIRDRVFEPFFTTKDVDKGTGLGLSTVYGFIKQSGGHVTVYSEPGEGTTFKLYLKATEPKKAGKAKKPASTDLKTKASGTILLVEDDKELRELIARALTGRGYTVLDVGDGPSALLIMADHPEIDLLLTDIVLPKGLSGIDIAKKFSKKYPDSGIILSSGYTEKAIEKNGWLKGEDEVLSKPYDLEVLYDWVQSRIKSQSKKS